MILTEEEEKAERGAQLLVGEVIELAGAIGLIKRSAVPVAIPGSEITNAISSRGSGDVTFNGIGVAIGTGDLVAGVPLEVEGTEVTMESRDPLRGASRPDGRVSGHGGKGPLPSLLEDHQETVLPVTFEGRYGRRGKND